MIGAPMTHNGWRNLSALLAITCLVLAWGSLL
jgi:hypothetical protein